MYSHTTRCSAGKGQHADCPGGWIAARTKRQRACASGEPPRSLFHLKIHCYKPEISSMFQETTCKEENQNPLVFSHCLPMHRRYTAREETTNRNRQIYPTNSDEDHPVLVSCHPWTCDLASSYFLPHLYQMAQRSSAVRIHGAGMPLINHVLQIWQGYCKNSAVQRKKKAAGLWRFDCALPGLQTNKRYRCSLLYHMRKTT